MEAKKEMSAEDRAKQTRIIQALLMKTVENGCTESEASEAASKALELMARYDLDHVAGTLADEKKTFVTVILDVKYANGWRVSLCDTVANNTGVFCTYQSRIDKISLHGQEHSVAGAQLIAEYLVHAVEDLAKKYAKRTQTGTRGRRQFSDGCAIRLSQMVASSVNLMHDPRLPVIRAEAKKEAKAWLEDKNKRPIKEGTSRLGQARSDRDDAYYDGHDSAGQIDIRGASRPRQVT